MNETTPNIKGESAFLPLFMCVCVCVYVKLYVGVCVFFKH